MSQDLTSSLNQSQPPPRSVPGILSPSLSLDFQPKLKISLGIWAFMSDLNCIVCRTPATKRCSICKSVSYCSKEHQKQDWRAHKDYCQKVNKAGANTFDAILFPATESKPRMVKVPYEVISGTDEYDRTGYHKPDLSFWFKHPNAAVKRYYFNQLGFDGPAVDPAMCFFFDDNFSMNKLPTNRCIVDVTGGKAGHNWSGNVVGLRLRDGSYDLMASGNMEEDLGAFAKYFQKYGSE